MAIIAEIPWTTGEGNIIVQTVPEQPNTFAISSSTVNENIERSQVITFQTTNTKGLKASVQLTVVQQGHRELYVMADELVFTNNDSNTFQVLKKSQE